MAVNDDITIAKGAFSVTIFTNDSADNYKNQLINIAGVVSPTNQGSGWKVPTAVDLLRITHSFAFQGYITASASKTGKQVKDDLINIFKGANVASTPVTLTYEDTAYNVFLEDMVIKKVNNDNLAAQSYALKDAAEYHVSLKVIEGKLVGT